MQSPTLVLNKKVSAGRKIDRDVCFPIHPIFERNEELK